MAANTNTNTRNTEYVLASGRVVYINFDGSVDMDYDGAGYAEYCKAEAEAERYAEFGSSYVFGGGQAEDVAAAYDQVGHMHV